MALGLVGEAAVPGSLSVTVMVARPRSVKTVGTLILTPFSSLLTSVSTSEPRVPPNLVGSAPDAPSSGVTMASTGPWPWRTNSPHPAPRTAVPAIPTTSAVR